MLESGQTIFSEFARFAGSSTRRFPASQSAPEPAPTDNQTYSGAAAPGLNLGASFDRVVYRNLESVLDQAKVESLFEKLCETFVASDRSRCVARVLAKVETNDLYNLASRFPALELDLYPCAQHNFSYLTLALNSPERALNKEQRLSQQRLVIERMHNAARCVGDFSIHALTQLEECQARGFSFCDRSTIDARQLAALWKVFGWSESACANFLFNTGSDQVLGLRDPTGRLVAVALYNHQPHTLSSTGEVIAHGETTEWRVAPEFSHHGLIVPLLIGLNCKLLSQGINNIWADLRAPLPGLPHSVSVAVKSGMGIFAPEALPFLSSNHVTIAGPPDPHNHLRGALGAEQLDATQLRSFVKGWVVPEFFTQPVKQAYLNAISGSYL